MATPPKRIAPRRLSGPDLPAIHTTTEEVATLKRQIDTLTVEWNKKRKELFALVATVPGEEETFQTGDGVMLTAQIIRPMPLVMDEAKLKKRLGAKLWQRLTIRVLDKGLLDAAIKTGVVSTTTVAEATDTVPGTPYVKVTAK